MKHNTWKRILICLFCTTLLLATGGNPGKHRVVCAASSRGKKTKKVFLNKKNAEIIVGGACNIKVKKASGTVKWSVNNKSVVRIKPFGKRVLRVYGKREGSAVVTAKVGSKKVRCTIKVISEDTMLQGGLGWYDGTWADNCYYNGSGAVLGDFNACMSESVPDIQAKK